MASDWLTTGVSSIPLSSPLLFLSLPLSLERSQLEARQPPDPLAREVVGAAQARASEDW